MDENRSLNSETRLFGKPPRRKNVTATSERSHQQVSIQKLTPDLEKSKTMFLREEHQAAPKNQVEELLKSFSKKKNVSTFDIAKMKKKLKNALKDKVYSKAGEPLKAPASRRCMITKDGKTLISGSTKGEIKIFYRPLIRSRFKLKNTLRIVGNVIVQTICLTRDEGVLFAGLENGKIAIWRRKNGLGWTKPEFIAAHESKLARIYSLAITPDGGTLFSASMDGTIKVWVKQSEGKYNEVQTLTEHTSSKQVLSVSVTDDGSTLFSGANDNKIMVWKKSGSGKSTRYSWKQSLDHDNFVRSVSCTPDGKLVVSASNDFKVRVWIQDKESYRLLQVLKGHSWQVTSVSVSDDGKKIFSVSADQNGIVWMTKPDSESPHYTQNQILTGNPNIVQEGAMSKNGNTLVMCGFDDDLFVFERKNINTKPSVDDDHSIQPVIYHKDHIQALVTLATTEDGKFLFSGNNEGSIFVWKKNLVGKLELFQLLSKIHEKKVRKILVTPSGSTLLSASEDGKIQIFTKILEGKYQRSQILEKHKKGVLDLALTKDGETLFSAGRDDVIMVWVKNQNGEFVFHEQLEGHTNDVWQIAITPNGKTLVSVSSDFTIRIWRKRKKKRGDPKNQEIERNKKEKKEVFQAKTAEQREKLFSYSEDQILRGHTEDIFSVALSQNGKTIVSGSQDNTVRVWMMKNQGGSRKFVHHQTLRGHSGNVISVRLSEDANTIFSGSIDHKLKIWEKSGHSYEFNSEYKQEAAVQDILVKKNKIYSVRISKILVKPFSRKSSFFQSIDESYYYSSLFYQALSKPTSIQTVQSLLQTLPSLREEDGRGSSKERRDQGKGSQNEGGKEEDDEKNLVDYERTEPLKIHHGVNPLYWFCIFQAPELLREALKRCDYQQWVYSQSDLFDPFLYSMRIDNKELIDVWADYFLKEGNEHKLVVRGHDLLQILLCSQSEKIQKLGISKLKGASAIHRDIVPIQVCGYDKDKGFLYCFTRDCFIDSDTKKMLKEKEDVSQEGITVTHESTLIPLSKGLSKLYWLISSVQSMAPQNKLELRPLILALFQKYRWYFYIYSLLNALGHLLIFTMVVFHIESWYLLIPFYIIYSLMALFEIIDIFNEGAAYFKSVYNLFDILLYPAGMVIVGTAARDNYQYLNEERTNFLVVLVLYFGLLRTITMLRVIKETRYLMLMLLRTYKDMTPFLVVMFIYLIGNGAIFMVINHTDGEVENEYTLKRLQIASDMMYNYGYGNWDGTDAMNDLTFFFYIHTGIFIGLVMFNLLIAIISGTYEEFVENRDMIDLEEIISMLTEMASFLRFSRWIKVKTFGPGKERGVFYHFLIPYLQEEDDLKEIQNRISMVEKGVKQSNKELKARIDHFRGDITSVKTSMRESQKSMIQEQNDLIHTQRNMIQEQKNLIQTQQNEIQKMIKTSQKELEDRIVKILKNHK